MSEIDEKEFEKATEQYGDSQIQVLEGLEAVRKRPGMYIGTTSVKGLHHLIYEIVDNSIDEALAGFCDEISVTLCADGSVLVEDDGRGVPAGMNEKLNLPTLEVIFATLHLGGQRAFRKAHSHQPPRRQGIPHLVQQRQNGRTVRLHRRHRTPRAHRSVLARRHHIRNHGIRH